MIKKLLTLWICLFVLFLTSIQAQNVDLYIDTVTVASGNNVTMKITADNFTEINVLEFVIQWDSTVLQYVSHQDYNSKMNLTNAHFSTPVGIGRADVFKIAWNDIQGVSLGDGETLFSITFKAIGSNGTQSPLRFTIGPPPFTSWEIVQNLEPYTETEKEEATHDGLVKITAGGGGASSVDLIGSDETVESGEVACVDVSVRNFKDIKSMDAFMRYDENLIEFKELKNLNLPQLGLGNFNTSVSGEIRLSYNYPEGATVSDNAVIFQACFNAIGANGTSSIFKFTGGNPNPPLEIVNTENKSLTVNTDHGSVSIGGTGGGLYLDIEDYEIDGKHICVPIRVSGFQDIVAYSHSISFNQNYMTFDSVRNFALALAGLGMNTNLANQGKLGFSWYASDGLPKNLLDNSILIELCFTLNNSCGGGTTMEFTDSPTERTFYEAPSVEIFPEYRNGNLSCKGKTVVESVTNATCGNCNGSISLTIDGWDVESISWSDGNLPSNPTVSGICPGTYSVTVSFTDNTNIIKNNIVVSEEGGADVSIVQVQADLGGSSGAIDINVSGSSTYTYEWSTGATTEDISGLDAGTYSITVTNENGCKTILDNITVLSVNSKVTDATCANGSDGTIDIVVSGGSGNFTYQWTCASGSGPSVSNVPPGNCTVTITDVDGGYTNVAIISVGSPSPITLTDITTTGDNGSGSGSINITVSGGAPPYTYAWQPGGATTEDISGLSAGSYSLTITDSNGCVFTFDPITVGEGGSSNVVIGTSNAIYHGYGVSCKGDCNGYINVQVNNLPNPAIVWGDESSDLLRSDLCAGSYSYTITSGESVVEEGTVVLEEPDALSIDEIDTQCAEGFNGEASAEILGGVRPYQYSWEGQQFGPDSSITGLAAGNYTLYIIDEHGCEAERNYFISECGEASGCFQGRKVITPNGDGLNDELVIKTCGNIESANISIYTQWGELIYQEDNYGNDWNGTTSTGDYLKDGLYHWILLIVLDSGETQVHKGSVNLVRTMN